MCEATLSPVVLHGVSLVVLKDDYAFGVSNDRF
jgi:hypothetical protein